MCLAYIMEGFQIFIQSTLIMEKEIHTRRATGELKAKVLSHSNNQAEQVEGGFSTQWLKGSSIVLWA